MRTDDKPLPTIAELEQILASETEEDIEIQPDGSLVTVPKGTAEKHEVKIITSKYAAAEFY